MTLNRAYSILEVKSVDEEQRTIEGIATTPTPDRMNDVVELDGIEFKLPMPFLYQHNSRQPIGNVISAKIVKGQMLVKVQIAATGIATFIDEAWNLIKAGLIRGLSIGFRSIEEAYNRDTGGYHYIRTEWMELSAVTIPAQAEATILSVKSADHLLRAALSDTQKSVVRLGSTLPGASGTPTKGKAMKKTTAEQIAAFETKLDASTQRMAAIMEKSSDEALRTLDAEETAEYDDLQVEVENIEGHISRLKAYEKTLLSRATPITKENTSDVLKAGAARAGVVQVRMGADLPKGTLFTRYVIALANEKGDRYRAADRAKALWSDSTPEVELILRAEVAASTTTNATNAAPLLPLAQNMISEFIELLPPNTINGRIPTHPKVPFNISVPSQTGGGTYGWVGEGAAKPVSAMAFAAVTLRFAKVAGIIVLTKELVKFSNPSAEAIVRQDMIDGTARFEDTQFVDPSVAAVSNVSPASITNGVTPTAASGVTAAAFITDTKALFASFDTANNPGNSLVWLMPTNVARGVSLLLNPLGQPQFPTITPQGGSLFGYPVIVSQNVGARVILANASDIMVADDGPVEIDVSEEASLQMNTAPGEPAGSPVSNTEMVSLWQRNYIGLRVDHFITWQKARTTAVAYISGANYG